MKTDSPLPKSNRVSGCVQRLVRLVDWLRSSPGPSDVDVWTARQWADDIESELNLPSCLLDVDAICEQQDKARDEANRYKIALEGIAGFPHQYFDGETPWRMRQLAEHALSLENAKCGATEAKGTKS